MELEGFAEALAIEGVSQFEEKFLTEDTWHYQGTILRADVGELQEKWQFPSDHLPIGVTVNHLHIGSWNVMNTCYFKWVENNSQGLRDSMLKDENYFVKGMLTRREEHTIEMTLEMLNHPTAPHSLLCLQECSEAFIEELQNQLPDHMKIVFSSETPLIDQNLVIYDSSVLEFDTQASKIDFPYTNSEPTRTAMNLVFHRGDETYRVVNVHVPGNPALPGAHDLGAYVAKEHRDGEITLCLGDMNFNETEMRNAFDQVESGYSLISPYPTNVGLDFYSKCIDHVFIKGASTVEVSSPESLIEGLRDTVNLLTQSRNNLAPQHATSL